MDNELVQRAHDELSTQQDRVAMRLGRLTDAGWETGLEPMGLERLVQMGHFPHHSWELDWSPREVAGHLRDSARVFAGRIERIRQEERPHLEDFRTDDPARLEEYRRLPPAQLVEQLEQAQAHLREVVAGVRGEELDRVGVHEVDGEVRLGELLEWLPEHQRDHAEQLAALTAETLA